MKKRQHLNHDWLGHVLVPVLANLVGIAEGLVSDPDTEVSFFEEILPGWPFKRIELSTLICEFELAMSPLRLFDHPPLSRCLDETAAWLRELTLTLWAQRHGIRELVEEAEAALAAVDAAMTLFRAKLPCLREGFAGDEFISALRAAHVACERLGSALSRFPREVVP